MKFSITWDGYLGRVSKDGSKGTLKVKPAIPNMKFDTLYFEPDDGNYFKTIDGFSYSLTEQNIANIEMYMSKFNIPPQSFHMVDVQGRYLGFLPEGSGRVPVPVAPPNGDFWLWKFTETNWYRPVGVDKEGSWVGNSPDIYIEASAPPMDGAYRYNFVSREWVETPESIKYKQTQDILNQLASIDKSKTRALTDALLTGNLTYLQELEAKAAPLRTQLKELLNVA